MKARGLILAIAAVAAWLAVPAPASAHRLDEYLQATRLAIDVDRVGLEIDLTAGASISWDVLNWIDTNGDGRISDAEGHAYAREMLRDVTLSVDGRPAPIALVDDRFPQFQEMSLGTGTIQLRAVANVPAVGGGHHAVSYSNVHRSDWSVYLVNALVPSDSRIQIAGQLRDRAQHGLSLDYDVTVSTSRTQVYWLLAVVAMAAVLLASRRFAFGGTRQTSQA